MRMQHDRHAVILDLIAQETIETQEQLTRLLRQRGFPVTQATVSRDIRQLGLVKEAADSGRNHYILPKTRRETGGKLHTIFRESVLSVQYAQNIVVLKTMPGLANGACATLDQMHIDGMVGTLAGDDTAFLAMRDTDTAIAFCTELRRMLRET